MAFDTNSEISGEFGETIGPPSISKRVSISNERVRTHDLLNEHLDALFLIIFVLQRVQSLDLPPDDAIERTLAERLTIFDKNHMKALVWKNFLWMWRNVAYVSLKNQGF